MKLEDQVVSVELAKELKELGVQQDSLWCWIKYLQATKWDLIMSWDVDLKHQTYAAFTVAELGEMLPSRIKTSDSGWCYLHTTKIENSNEWLVVYYADEIKESTEADSRAKMLLLLIKKGLVKVEEVGKK